MNSDFLRNRTVQRIIQWIVALSFALFTFYQIILAIIIEETRFGRLIGIAFYLIITVAAFLGFSEKKQKSEEKIEKIETVQMVLLVIGLCLLFAMRMLSIGTVFGNLKFAYPGTVLYTATYFLSQLGTLTIISAHFVLMSTLSDTQMEKVTNILMFIAIGLYTLCFVAECVMLIKYRFNIEQSLKFTLISRVWYFLGFAGTAFCFMLPVPTVEEEVKSGEFIYSDEEDGGDEIDLVI